MQKKVKILFNPAKPRTDTFAKVGPPAPAPGGPPIPPMPSDKRPSRKVKRRSAPD